MKKNVIIAVLTLISVFSVAFGYQQKLIAEKFKLIAEENERRAREQAERALQEVMIAKMNLRKAVEEAEAKRKLAEKNK